MEAIDINNLTDDQRAELEKEIEKQQEILELVSRIPNMQERIQSLEETHTETNFHKLLQLYKAENLLLNHNMKNLILIVKNLQAILKSVKLIQPYLQSEAGQKIELAISDLKN